jgi:sialate O-acetylesterase
MKYKGIQRECKLDLSQRRKRMKRQGWMIGVVIFCAFTAQAEVTVSKVFGDHMVLQRGIEVPVWGWADPGEEVTVKFGGRKQSAKADKSGKWLVRLKPMKASSKGRILSVQEGADAKTTIKFTDVLVGEVWLCSGQSNMDYEVGGGRRGKRSLLAKFDAEAEYPAIRHFTVPEKSAVLPQNDMAAGAGWQVCSPATVARFTAAGYFFGRMLHTGTDLPVGLISSAVGGTRIESWTPAKTLKEVEGCEDKVREVTTRGEALRNGTFSLEKAMDVWWSENDPGSVQPGGWMNPTHDVSGWKLVRLPSRWASAGIDELKSYKGVVWFHRVVDIPDGLAGKDMEISLGKVDDRETTYFNGVKIGAEIKFDMPRIYKIPGKLVTAGRNVITVSVYNGWGDGGIWGNPEELSLYPTGHDKNKISLAGEWRYKRGLPNDKMATAPNTMGKSSRENLMTGLYNGMIDPIVPYAIRGAIWYQGESNEGEGNSYMHKMHALVKGWRNAWDQGKFPFYYVQLANFQDTGEKPEGGESWAKTRMAQLKSLDIKNTGMAVAIELADEKNPGDVHPENKKDVGERLALWALAKQYGKDITCSGPLYKRMNRRGTKAFIHFDYTGKGLMVGEKTGIEPVKEVTDGTLKQFAISGEDGKWHWADAEIRNDTVVVSSTEVKKPVAVRYGYTMNPDGCNLYNKDGLPASPFTTDDHWK